MPPDRAGRRSDGVGDGSGDRDDERIGRHRAVAEVIGHTTGSHHEMIEGDLAMGRAPIRFQADPAAVPVDLLDMALHNAHLFEEAA